MALEALLSNSIYEDSVSEKYLALRLDGFCLALAQLPDAFASPENITHTGVADCHYTHWYQVREHGKYDIVTAVIKSS